MQCQIKISTRFFMNFNKSILKVTQWVKCKKTQKIFEEGVLVLLNEGTCTKRQNTSSSVAFVQY